MRGMNIMHGHGPTRGGKHGLARWWAVFGWLALVFAVLAIPAYCWMYVNFYKQTDALLNNAQTAGEPKDMLMYLERYRANLDRLGMTRGYLSLIHSEDADMAAHVRKVDNVIRRLCELQTVPTDPNTYELKLGNSQNTLREISNPASGWVWTHGGAAGLLVFTIVLIPWIVGRAIELLKQ